MSRKRICARSLDGGPGTCWHWWDGCPKGVEHCFVRFIRHVTGQQFGGKIDRAAAEGWQARRDAARNSRRATQLGLDLPAPPRADVSTRSTTERKAR
jgi:hypothetical protein